MLGTNILVQRMKLDPFLTHIQNNNSKEIKHLNVEAGNSRSLGKKTGVHHALRSGNGFLDMTPKVWATKEK